MGKQRILIVLVLLLILAMPALALTPRRGVLAGRPGDMELLSASWWENGTLRGVGRGFVPTVAGRAELGAMRFSRGRGWVMTLQAPNIQDGARMTARETAIALHTIRVRWPYARYVSPTIYGTCAGGSYDYGLSDVVAEYEKLYNEPPWFDAIGIQVSAPTAEEAICRIEQVVNEARSLGYGDDTELWLTGFSCWPDVEDKPAYMVAMLEYITASEIARYAWHPARRAPGIWYDWNSLQLIDERGELTELGAIYAERQ